MKFARKLAGGLAVVVLAVACQRPPEPPPSAAMVVEAFLAGYRGNFREADPSKLSGNLSEALQSVRRGEKESAERVKASEFPSDKPLILEGEIFSGLYEGFTGYEIGDERLADGRAAVEVRFRNEPYDVTWTDEVTLVDENGWKIDDVRYVGKKAGLLSLREVLQDFEVAAAAEAAAARPPKP
jgi:hypothetical protein